MKPVFVHAALAVVGTLVAWYVWTNEGSEDVPHEAVELLECASFERATFTTETRTVQVETREMDGEDTLWVVVNSEPAEGEATTKSYLGGEAATEWANHFDPFRALRSLGEVPEDELEPLEFTDDSPTFELVCTDGTVTYKVGGTSFGGDSRYVMSTEGGPVYLLAGPILSELRAAENSLVQRDLHRFEMTDVDQLELSAGEHSLMLKQRDRHDPRAAIWVDASDPDRRNDLFGNWISRLTQLTAMNYLGADESPDNPESILSLRYLDEDGDEIETMELVRVEAEPAEYYARTSTTRGWVQVPASTARQVENDGRTASGLEPLERPEDAAPVPEEGTELVDGAETETEGETEMPNPHAPNPIVPDPHSPSPQAPSPQAPNPQAPNPRAPDPHADPHGH